MLLVTTEILVRAGPKERVKKNLSSLILHLPIWVGQKEPSRTSLRASADLFVAQLTGGVYCMPDFTPGDTSHSRVHSRLGKDARES